MPERLCYSPQAQLDLDEIYDYFADELNIPDKGQMVVSDILSSAEKVLGRATRFPPVGSLPFTEDVYRFAAVGNYLVFFREVEGIIYVDRILSKRRDFASLLGETRRGVSRALSPHVCSHVSRIAAALDA